MNDHGLFSVAGMSRLIGRVGVWRFAFWFVAINFSISAVLSAALLAWLGDQRPNAVELVVRGVLAVIFYGAGMVLFVWLMYRAGKSKESSPDAK